MFSLRDFHNLVGQSSEQCSLTGAGQWEVVTSSGKWFEDLWVFLPKFFIFFFFLMVICLWLPWHHSICFPKVGSFLAGFGLLEGAFVALVPSEGCWHWVCPWLDVAAAHGADQVPM